MKLFFSGPIIEKYSNIKEGKHQSSGNKVVPWGRANIQTNRQIDRQTDRQTYRHTDRQTDMAKLIAIFAILRMQQKTISYSMFTFFRHSSRRHSDYKH